MTKFPWFCVFKLWVGSFPSTAPLTQHCSCLGRLWAESWAKKLPEQQRLGNMMQRKPSSSGQSPARSSYSQCSVTGHLCCALLSCPALQRLLLWYRAWCDSLEPVLGQGAECCSRRALQGCHSCEHRATWAALHLSHGARLSTHLNGPHPHFSASHIPNETPAFLPVQNTPIIVFFITPVFLGVGER